jgi:CHAT domain-containing protein
LSIATMLVVAGCRMGDGASPSERLDRALVAQRFTLGRLARQTTWEACRIVDTTSVVPRTQCGTSPQPGTRAFDEIDRLTRDAREALRDSTSPTATHTLALADLRWYESIPTSLDQAITTFEHAMRLAPKDAALLNDAAVAFVAQGERDGTLRPLMHALDAIERARLIDSVSASILFNRALILDRLYLDESADSAWATYLRVERSRSWRREAERTRQRLAARRAIDPFAGALDSLVRMNGARMTRAIGDRVRQSPQAAREFAFAVLSEWGRLPSRDPRARKLLAIAKAIAAGVDSARSVQFAVADIAACASDTVCLRDHALGHAALGDGIDAFNRASFDEALGMLDSAQRRFGSLRSAASRWAAFYRAASLVSRGEYARGDTAFLALLDSATDNEPVLVGKAMLGIGVSQMRRGNYDVADQWIRRGIAAVERSKEQETIGFAHYLRTGVLLLVGQRTESHEEAYLALAMLAAYRRSNYLNNQLEQVAWLARDEGLHFAAAAITDEMLPIARRLKKPDVLARALSTRAHDLIEVGRTGDANATLDEADQWAARMPSGRGLDRIRASVLMSRGQIVRVKDPMAAVPLLDQAVALFQRFPQDGALPTALFERARAARALGDTGSARQHLDAAIATLERQQSGLLASELRASFAENVENVFDEMVSLEMEAKRGASAFEYFERGRSAAWPLAQGNSEHATTARPASIAALQKNLQAGTMVVEYALLRDRTVIWTVTRDAAGEYVIPVPRDTIAALVERLGAALSVEQVTVADARARLFDLLITPLERFDAIGTVIVVPDREIHRVPFGALWDSRAKRYAIESHEFRTVPSAGYLLAAGRDVPGLMDGDSPLIIGNPTPSVANAPLGRLPGAEREASQIAQSYRRSTLLSRSEATRARVVERLATASSLHFAGHAVFDDDRPELSYLALAGDSVSESRLRAREIGNLRLSQLRLVVLSACSTLNPRSTRNGPVAGLAYSFLAAGTPALISTLWDVRDDAAADLLVAFHRRLVQHDRPSEALRETQLEALHSQSTYLRIPRTWAAFTYTGP